MNTAQSFWEKETYQQTFDFTIIGSGFTGMQVALQIRKKHPKATIAIADKGSVSEGASLRNAGFACFGSASEILDDITNQDKNLVYDLVDMRYQGLQHLVNDFGKEAINYQTGNAKEVFLPKEQEQYALCLDALSGINKSMQSITGMAETYNIKTHQLKGNFLPLAIGNELEGHLHTGKLYHTIQKQVIAANIFWISGFEVTGFEQVNEHWYILGKENKTVKTKHVISCINAATHLLIPNAELAPARGQIIVTEPLKKQVLNGILHADKGYIYARPLGERILIGGARNTDFTTENTFEIAENKHITNALLDFVNTMLLEEETKIQETWSCIMAMSPQKGGLPIIKEHQPNLWLCYRLGGMGVALSSVISRKMAALIS